jgi:ATP-dependent helicase/nuclease subunit B
MILTKSNSDKINIDDLILQKVHTGSLRELLLVVPTNRKVRYLKRDIISSATDHSISEINIETLATISTQLFNEARNFNAKILSDATSVVLLNQSFSGVELQYFSDYKKEIPRGTLELVKNVISEYKRQGIGPEDIRREAKQLTGSERYKALDIANIYSSYLKKTSGLSAYELGDIYKYLINLTSKELLKAFFSLYGDVSTLIVNGFDEFSQPEIELINRLADLHGISMYVVFDYFKYNNQIFAHLEKCYNNLIDKGFREIEDSSVAGFDHFRDNIRENLFSYKRTSKPESAIDIIKIEASNSF